ncbi:MAG TPA: PIN domain-containing protein [Mycobacteriales bacterium]|nr:PIN domain-containing protein [Mycobacteriales bacterium]
MARLILDTTVLIDAERRGRRLDRLIADQDDVAIAAVTAAELLVGVELADDARRPARTAFVRSVLDTVPLEDYDLQVARVHATLLAHSRRTGRPRGAHDLIIAATAAARDRLVVSTDTTAFADLPGVAVRT